MTGRGMSCLQCGSGPGEACKAGCGHQYRQEAGQHHRDGADYLRDLWARWGAPTAPARGLSSPDTASGSYETPPTEETK